MTQLETIAPWKLEFQRKKTTNDTNNLSIATLNTHSLHAHIDDIVHDIEFMNNMVLCLQETHLHVPPKNKQFMTFNFPITHFIHGIITCIKKRYQSMQQKPTTIVKFN
jgi:hypothetical protein